MKKGIPQASDMTSIEQIIKGIDNTEVQRLLATILQKKKFNVVVLQREIEEGPNSWPEHYISLIYLDKAWMTVDFTANQINRYNNSPFVVVVSEPDKCSLKKSLTNACNWWFQNSQDKLPQ